MKLQVRLAETHADILRCQYAIAEVYNREYEVVFSTDHYDLEAKIEPWPHRYLMLLDGDTLAAAVGLYLRETYVERFGGITRDDIERVLREAGAADRYDARELREVTKLVVTRPYRGRGLSPIALGCAHSTGFMQHASTPPPLVVFCAKRSIMRSVYGAAGLQHRLLKPFPLYKVHELYRSEDDPMESRLMIPDLDVPARWYNLTLPAVLEVEANVKEST